jgi:ATP-dependent Lhr-like helicase
MHKGKARSQAIRNTPITLVYREQLAAWQGARKAAVEDELSADAMKLLDILQQRGASFFSELISRSGLLRTQVENALSELVAHGRISADSFSGLRALLTPASKRPSLRAGRRRRPAANPIELAGRWGVLDTASTNDDQAVAEAATEAIAWSLLRRYGVITRRLLERESLAPPWRELLRVYRRLEARGEIRGGRFVARFTGEQYALPEALTMMRKVRKQPHDGAEIQISASDPLNLTGIISSGKRVSSSHTRQILYQDGEMVRVVH